MFGRTEREAGSPPLFHCHFLHLSAHAADTLFDAFHGNSNGKAAPYQPGGTFRCQKFVTSAVEKLKGGRQEPGLKNAINKLRRIAQGSKTEDARHPLLGKRKQPERGLTEKADAAHRADEQLAQVVSGYILDRLAAHADDLTIGGHVPDAEDHIPGKTVQKLHGAAGIGGNDAA